ncbi:hypothetical protein ACFL1X_03710, partial [Candidatus Hydrogenedentota bacterium]
TLWPRQRLHEPDPLGRIVHSGLEKMGRQQQALRGGLEMGAFARVKELLHWKRCRTWGKQEAYAEALWCQITHNLMLLTEQWKPLTLKEQVV